MRNADAPMMVEDEPQHTPMTNSPKKVFYKEEKIHKKLTF